MALSPFERVGSEHGGGEWERLALRLFVCNTPPSAAQSELAFCSQNTCCSFVCSFNSLPAKEAVIHLVDGSPSLEHLVTVTFSFRSF